MFGFKRRAEEKQRLQAATEKGEEAGKAMSDAVEEYLDRRLPEVSNNVLNILRHRLQNIPIDTQNDPKGLAYAEFRCFEDNVADYRKRLKTEVHENLKEWMAVAAQCGVLDLLDELIDQKTEKAFAKLNDEARNAVVEVIAAINKSDKMTPS